MDICKLEKLYTDIDIDKNMRFRRLHVAVQAIEATMAAGA